MNFSRLGLGALLLPVVFSAGCLMPPSEASASPAAVGSTLTVNLTAAAGSNALAAAWVETSSGAFVQTIYVTKAIRAVAASRPMALPVWLNRSGLPVADAVTGATVNTTTTVRSAVLEPGTYFVYCEVNKSWDYNSTFTSANSDPNGQPSVVYRAALTVDGQVHQLVPDFYGQGSPVGGTGAVTQDATGLTTALSLLTVSLTLD